MTATEVTWAEAPTRTVTAGEITFPYRELGPRGETPLVLLHHLAAVLDDWDPRVVDGLAATRHVITFDNRGVGAATGTVPTTIEQMAADAVTFIRALGHREVDLFGFSMGGFIAQVIAVTEPGLVRRMAIAGSGPAGGVGIDRVTRIAVLDSVRATLTRQNPKQLLFFTRTPNGRARGREFVARLAERTRDRDTPISVSAFRRQLTAIHAWGEQPAQDLGAVTIPVFVANGEHDRMVPSSNTHDLAARFPDCRIEIYPDAGHGGVFQHHDRFVASLTEFLRS